MTKRIQYKYNQNGIKIKHESALSVRHVVNILKLKTYLQSLPKTYDGFDMGHFVEPTGWGKEPSPESACSIMRTEVKGARKERFHECGTSACMVGHGPAAGLRPRSSEAKRDWNAYMIEKFGYDLNGYMSEGDEDGMYDPEAEKLMDYLFGGQWRHHGNTIKAGIARINRVARNGWITPEDTSR